MIIYTK
nr:unnamed protein product [Callosobruchus analis]